jgi:hypothetical protein
MTTTRGNILQSEIDKFVNINNINLLSEYYSIMNKKTIIILGIFTIVILAVISGIWRFYQKNEQGCIALAVPMRNQETNECKVFSTPCDVPKEGWIGDTSCLDSLIFTGKMTFSPVEGGCWDFISDDGKDFELTGEKAAEIKNIPDILSKKIRIEGRIRKDMSSICFGGRDGFFEVKSYEVINDISTSTSN